MSPYMKRKQQLKHRILRARKQLDKPNLELEERKALIEKVEADTGVLEVTRHTYGKPSPPRKSRGKKLSKAALAESIREVA